MSKPKTTDFEKIAKDFMEKWNLPNYVGALDGKHVRIQCPESGSLYFNYKNYFSIVLLAVVDANYKFITIDVGSYGKEGDSGILEQLNIGHSIRSGNFQFPIEKALPASDIVVPYIRVGDEAFRLTNHVMKLYTKNQAAQDATKTVFNYRLCRARRVSENAFALLSQGFRIFYSPIAGLPETTDLIIIITCCLHNMLREEYISNISKQIVYDTNTQPNNSMLLLARAGGFGNIEGFEVRDKFQLYFIIFMNINKSK